MRTLFVLLLCVIAARAATHVNISIAHQPATNPADVTYLEGSAPADLKAGPTTKVNGDERSARLRVAEENESDGNVQKNSEQKEEEVSSSNRDSRPAQQVQQVSEQTNAFKSQKPRFYGRIRQSNRPSQFRQANAQDKQNQEFERYIQNYHSGPTVETVFEQADHSPSARYQYSSSSSTSSGPARLVAIDAKPQQQHTFERQVALPTSVDSAASAPAEEQSKSAPDAKIQVSPASGAALPAAAAPVTVQVSSPVAVNSAPSAASSTSSKTSTTTISGGSDGGKVGVGGSFGAAYGGPNAGSPGVTFRLAGVGGYNQPSFDGYGKPDYAQPSYNYDQGDADGYLDEYPPSVEEPAGGYDGFYGGQENEYHPNSGYIPSPPVYQRPVVTKTIQIAQPALKAKKFEVRHPAIQKEFYDIEERVVIKPAGTIVVELEHPVAKIPKGETVLPLGHPHPAIAAQYNLNSDADIETESSSAGSFNNGLRSSSNQVYASAPRKQPSSVISGTNIGSTVTATPSNNQNAKRDFVEANLRKQYGEEVQFVATAENAPRESKQRVKDLYIPAESQGNQRQVLNRNYAPNTFRREESNYQQRPARVELKNNDEAYRSKFSKNDEQPLKNNAPDFQSSFSNDDDDYRGEYITGNFYSAVNKDPKPARLQEEPRKSERITAEPIPQIIKHEHTINIPPSQHNIYISPSRLEDRPVLIQEPRKQQAQSRKQQAARLEDEPAQVQEVKGFLERQREGGVVYVVPARRPVATKQRYTQNERRQPQQVSQQPQQRSYARLRYDPDADVDASVEYSEPYSHMRFDPRESARLTADVDYNRNANENAPQQNVRVTYSRGPEPSARLVAQNKSESDVNEPAKSVQSNEEAKPELRQLAHIQLQVPYGAQEADEPIRVFSSINPPRAQSPSENSKKTAAKQVVDDQVEQINVEPDAVQSENQEPKNLPRSENVQSQPDCNQSEEKVSARYENSQQNEDDNESQYAEDESGAEPVKYLRLIDASDSNSNSKENAKPLAANIQGESADVNGKDAGAHATPPGSRVIAANPAPNDASATSESFHKRRIVVNHPFQTVREVVEHEPITNYHQIQVHEPASPTSAYNKAPYFAPNGALRQFEMVHLAMPVTYQRSSGVTHGNLVYALPDAIPVHEDTGEEDSAYQQKRQRLRT